MTGSSTDTQQTQTIAAIDLGSNSFHLILAEISRNHCKILRREKRKVRLAAGLDKHDNLNNAAIDRAVETLAAFGEIIDRSQTHTVRTVGTFTFRTARNIEKLLRKVQKSYPYPIEILAGAEEARLIYQGVFQDAHLDKRTLVVDIGGGSTELVIGETRAPLTVHSCTMGCVSITEKFFGDGAIDEDRFQSAFIQAEQQLEPLVKRYLKLGWQQVIGTSGSIKALSQCAIAMNLSDGTLTHDVLLTIRQQLLSCGHISRINLPGLNPDQGPIICGGLAILLATFEMLSISGMSYCDAALREGLLFDLQARMDDRDVRHHSVSALARRFDSDSDYSNAVSHTCSQLFQVVAKAWQLSDEEYHLTLKWAAELHEIGLHINYDRAHTHAAYIVRNTIMPGFSNDQQTTLAYLLKTHRGRFNPRVVPSTSLYKRDTLYRLSVLLRMAVLINRCRQPTQFAFTTTATKLGLHVSFSQDWKPLQCLLEADLQQEKDYWNFVKLSLEWEFVE